MMKYVSRANAILWSAIFLATCFQSVWEHALPEVDPFVSFSYLAAAFALSLAALAGEETK
jgi:predicted small integral membrane protein